jgi:hypothetical protein
MARQRQTESARWTSSVPSASVTAAGVPAIVMVRVKLYVSSIARS